MRSKFDEQLALLHEELIEMGALCEDAITIASRGLSEGCEGLGERLNPVATAIDHKERDIEAKCMRLLLQQQPVAGDLRLISAALKMITDMERIGDQAEDIAEIITYLDGHNNAEESALILQMAHETIQMVTRSVDAFVKSDISLAESVIAHDDVVDDYFDKVKGSLIEMVANNTQTGEYALDILMIAKYFERIGDHATNIAEWVVFSITGRHKEG